MVRYNRDGSVVPGRRSRSSRAGILFPVGRVDRQLRKGPLSRSCRVGHCAPVYMAAVLEYLAAEVLEQAGLLAKRAKARSKKDKTMIIPKHIVVAVGKDEELTELCQGATMTGGGHFAALLPSTQPRLRAELEGEEEREELEEVDSKPRDPMFGKWIQAQASLHKSVEESFSEQVEAEYRRDRSNEKKRRKSKEKQRRRLEEDSMVAGEGSWMSSRGGSAMSSRGGSSMLSRGTILSSSGSSDAPVASSSIKDNRRRLNMLVANKATSSSAGGQRSRSTSLPRPAMSRDRREPVRDKRKESIQERQRLENMLAAALDQTSKHKPAQGVVKSKEMTKGKGLTPSQGPSRTAA